MNDAALGRAVHSLSRIGDELYFEPMENGLCLRSVNSSRSAYACFTLAPLFFLSYETTGGACHCKIHMKSVVSVFRSLPSLEKTVEKCLISLNTTNSRLVIQLLCKYGVMKTHNLSYQDCESLQAVYNSNDCPNILKAPARLLTDVVVHFPLTLAEVTLMASPCGKVTLRNYIEDDIGKRIKLFKKSILHTGTVLPLLSTEDDFLGDDIDYMIAMETTLGKSPPHSPAFGKPSDSSLLQKALATASDSDEDPERGVPGTPPNKRFRSLFFGSVLASSRHSNQEILAEDSDGES
ncbi:hypothetical protein GDO86_012988 [Hymenochirus boettgeri]|uniref:Cell cycle checkpoint control protein RAD9A n=1 Tax=Hymenochirus boettgeri TaxID=247094 RepID=A0A8T2ITG0_9PIPI|nr:hypothetical protein GDO86_012988 [Hymenochirus boettgeri]